MKKETFGLWSGWNFLSASQPSTTSATANPGQMSKQKHYLRVGRLGGGSGALGAEAWRRLGCKDAHRHSGALSCLVWTGKRNTLA